jgi:TolB protein
MNSDGSAPRQVTFTSTPDTQPAWSPDGNRIAFSRGVSSSNRDIFLINPDGSGLTRFTQGLIEAADPSWSPDGKQITFSYTGCEYYYYYSYNCNPTVAFRVLSDPSFSLHDVVVGSNPVWNP